MIKVYDLVYTLLNNVYYEDTGKYANTNKAYGVSILIPTYSSWQNYNGYDQYNLLKINQDTYWYYFVQRFAYYTQY